MSLASFLSRAGHCPVHRAPNQSWFMQCFLTLAGRCITCVRQSPRGDALLTTLPLSSTAYAESHERKLPALIQTLTVRNWVRTLAWTWAAVSLCGLIYLLDKWGVTGTDRKSTRLNSS